MSERRLSPLDKLLARADNALRTLTPGTIQATAFPSGPSTSMWIQQCGLIHSIFVTLPFSVTGLVPSNSAEKA